MDTIRENQSEKIGQLATALAKAQSTLQPAKRDASNPFFKSHYATMESIWEAIRDTLTKNGLSIVQSTELVGTAWAVRTVLIHSSGEWIDSLYPILSDKPGAQSFGAGHSYARRFSLMGVVGIPTHDDDGESITVRGDETVINRQLPANTSGFTPGMPNRKITEPQRKRLFAKSKAAGLNEDDVKKLITSFGYQSTADIGTKDYDTICNAVDASTSKHPAPEGFEFVAWEQHKEFEEKA